MTQFLNNVNVSAKAVTASQGVLIGTQTTIPPASVYNVGCTVQYVGTAGTYTPGRFYTCVQEGAGYQWVESSLISTGFDVGTADRAIITDGTGMAVASGVSATELGYLSGVTAGIQGQLNGKVPTSRTINGKPLTDNITLSASDIGAAPSSSVLEASRALQSSSNGEVSVSNVTAVELSYLGGVTSAIQTQLNNKADTTDIPTLLSQLTNDTGFVTNSVSDLINYYTKDDTYSQEEINNMISAIPKFSIQVVQSLPSSNISTTTIYLVPKTASTNDSYDEYIYVSNTWEKIGSTAVSLDDYYTKAQVNAMVTPVQSATGITLNGVALQPATASQQGLMTVAQVGQLTTAVSNAQSALNGNVTGGTFSTDSSGNLTLTLNRTAGALNIGPTALTAAKAVADASGNNIASTYATQSALTSGLAGKADAGTEITGGAFSDGTLTLNKATGSISIPIETSSSDMRSDISLSIYDSNPLFEDIKSDSFSTTAPSYYTTNWNADSYCLSVNNIVYYADRYLFSSASFSNSQISFAYRIVSNKWYDVHSNVGVYYSGNIPDNFYLRIRKVYCGRGRMVDLENPSRNPLVDVIYKRILNENVQIKFSASIGTELSYIDVASSWMGYADYIGNTDPGF